MQKASKTAMPFESFLETAGATFDYHFAEYGQGLAATTDYRFRYSADEVEIAVNRTFDRWANSVDIVCRPLPANQETFNALLAALDKAVQEKRISADGEGSYDIWPLVRKVRREQQSTIRLALRTGMPPAQSRRTKTRLQRLALKVRKKVTKELKLAREHPQVKEAFLQTWQSWGTFARLMPSADEAWRAVETL